MKAMLSLLVLLTFVSCSSTKEKKALSAEAKESKVTDGKALGQTISELIHSSETLTPEQKKELEVIMANNKQTAESLNEQSFQYRSVLIKSLLSGKVNRKEVDILKKRIKTIEGQKLKNTFDTVEKITKLVDKHEQKEKFADHLLMIDKINR